MTELTVRTIHTGDQYVPAICERDITLDKVTCIYGSYAEGIGVAFVTVRDHDQASVPQYRGNDYPLERIQNSLRRIAEDRGLGSVPHDLAARFIPGLATIPAPASAPAEADRTIPDPDGGRTREPSVLRSSPSVIGVVCAELGIDPAVARRTLRAAGLSAPYTDADAIRKVLRGAK